MLTGWVRCYDKGAGGYAVKTLDGVADDKGNADGIAVLNFSQAQKAARETHAELAQAAKAAAPEVGKPLRSARLSRPM